MLGLSLEQSILFHLKFALVSMQQTWYPYYTPLRKDY